MKRGFRPSLREQMRQSLAAQKWLAAGAPDEKKEIAAAHLAGMEAGQLPPVRHRTVARSGKPLERNIKKAIIKALRKHPLVVRVENNVSALLQAGDRVIRVGHRGKPDLTVFLRDGRYIGMEIKRPGENAKPHQQERIDAIRAAGGIAGVAHSVAEASELVQVADALRDA